MLVTSPVNVRYLTGFTGSNGLAVVGPDRVHLHTDSRYRIQAEQECDGVDVIVAADVLTSAAGHDAPLALEAEHLTVAQHTRLVAARSGPTRATTGLVESLRSVKEACEIDAITRACAIATTALTHVLAQVRPGLTERDVATMLERSMIDLGADDRAFESIVAAGGNSAIPHHHPTDRPLQTGDLLKIDFGAKVGGYHSDCTRTFTIGRARDWQVEAHARVLAAQRSALAAVRADAPLAAVDGAARGVLAAHEGAFEHGLGHGVGLEIHEDPFFRQKSAGRLSQDVVVTVEPGLYLAERGGVRIEDTVLVTASGYELLTDLPTDLLEIA